MDCEETTLAVLRMYLENFPKKKLLRITVVTCHMMHVNATGAVACKAVGRTFTYELEITRR
jgi:hypothetical protein